MTKEETFALWSPEASIWSAWVKPVLFAHLDMGPPDQVNTDGARDVSWAPSPAQRLALVLDLPGAEAVHAGLALAARGYQPVPLYNALPLPAGYSLVDPLSGRRIAAVDVLPIVNALRSGAPHLAHRQLPPDAPPAFLLDANRHGDQKPLPDEFDNRSVCFTTDFPSANFLLAHGIQGAVLVQTQMAAPQSDLAHVLRRWQEGGLSMERMQPGSLGRPEPFEVSRPSWYGAMFQRVLASIRLRPASGGGFGDWLPESGSGG